MITKDCKHCGSKFSRSPSAFKNGRAKFCSRRCIRKFATLPIEERFKKYVGEKTASGCILWSGTLNSTGYGVIGTDKQHSNMLAHRLSYEISVGKIPTGLYLLHKCDNPPCINPKHLFPGTQKDNMRDMISRGRSSTGTDRPNAKLNPAKVREIRRRYQAGEGQTGLGRKFGVTQNLIRGIVMGKRWTHVH